MIFPVYFVSPVRREILNVVAVFSSSSAHNCRCLSVPPVGVFVLLAVLAQLLSVAGRCVRLDIYLRRKMYLEPVSSRLYAVFWAPSHLQHAHTTCQLRLYDHVDIWIYVHMYGYMAVCALCEWARYFWLFRLHLQILGHIKKLLAGSEAHISIPTHRSWISAVALDSGPWISFSGFREPSGSIRFAFRQRKLVCRPGF